MAIADVKRTLALKIYDWIGRPLDDKHKKEVSQLLHGQAHIQKVYEDLYQFSIPIIVHYASDKCRMVNIDSLGYSKLAELWRNNSLNRFPFPIAIRMEESGNYHLVNKMNKHQWGELIIALAREGYYLDGTKEKFK